ncbi:MAG: alanine--tRNA ligase [Candidatus Hadarchaeales archaeon]
MKDIYQVELFEREGFQRKQCSGCGRSFWTVDPDRKTCGDTPCDEYTFIGNSPMKRKYSLEEMEKTFLKFFEKNGHTVIKRYPVVARWRDDIFLTIASIADFQPWVTSGLVPPPANPLVVSQPSIRLKDIDNVGRSGRHFTLFFMGGHHAFNSRKKRVYWTDETVELAHEFFTKTLKIKPWEITYIEDFWEGGGNAGEDFEVNIRGLEVATLVFMHYSGEGGNYAPLPLQIVDTGYGMERLVWLSHGSPTSYEPVFGPVIERLRSMASIQMPPEEVLRENSKMAGIIDIESGRDLHLLRSRVAKNLGMDVGELEKMLAPLEAIYALADHLRCLAFMFADGVSPSNVREGYLARLVLRRAMKLMKEAGVNARLSELMASALDEFGKQFHELKEKSQYILEVVEREENKFAEVCERGRRLVERITREAIAKNREISTEELTQLYESHGLPPELVKEIAEGAGVKVEIPEDFYIKIAKSHTKPRHVPVSAPPVSEEKLKKVRPTKLLFYTYPYLQEFKAKVVKVIGNYVILDKTAFYPEGGGQPSDTGEMAFKEAKARVREVMKVGDVVLHLLEHNPFHQGQTVTCRIDWGRRKALMANHTATHILLGAAQRVLGSHVWQQGVQKGIERSRLDISHYKPISREELEKIELLANEIIWENRPVRVRWMERNDAEKKYGFSLYQGGVVPGKLVRVVEIVGWNTQACAGTHCSRTGEVGMIKIVGHERIQDGVERIEFAVERAALSHLQKMDEKVMGVAEVLRSPPGEIERATRQLFEEMRAAQRKAEKLAEVLAAVLAERLKEKVKKAGETSILIEKVERIAQEEMVKLASLLTTEMPDLVVVLLGVDETVRVVVMAGKKASATSINCGKIAGEVSKVLGGGGGGRADFGQGGGVKREAVDEALTLAERLCLEMVGGSQAGTPSS